MIPSESDRQLRQTAAEILAIAVLELFPTAQLVRGGPTRAGFGYHFVLSQIPREDDLVRIQEAMTRLIRAAEPIRHREMMRDNAAQMVLHLGQPLRAQRVLAGPPGLVDVFEVGPFRDVARAPFPADTGAIGAFELTTLEVEPPGATFIGGIVFGSASELKRHRRLLVEAKKRDHRKLGPELELFCSVPQAGAALWLWQPKGMILCQELLAWWRQGMEALGASPICTPGLYRASFFSRQGLSSGIAIDEGYASNEERPIGHALLAGTKLHSYKDLPLAYCEVGRRLCDAEVGEIGLARARERWLDQSTFFCSAERIGQVVDLLLQFILLGLKMLGFESQATLCTYAPNVHGLRRDWEAAQEQIAQVVRSREIGCEQVAGRAGATGPAVEILVVDSLGRVWPGPMIQWDLSLPKQFDLRYQGADGMVHPLCMVSASLFRSVERFVALLLEHFEGYLPVWLAPEQVRILPVTEDHRVHAGGLCERLRREGVRGWVDARAERLAGRVRLAQLARIPYTVVIGEEEQKRDRVAVREGITGRIWRCAAADWLAELKEEIKTKALGGRISRD
jgi:threonyl-tRNA synthetase